MAIECNGLPDIIQLVCMLIKMSLPVGSLSLPYLLVVVLSPIYLVIYPWLLVFRELHVRKHERRDGYRRTEPEPLPLESSRWRRRRALSLEGEGKQMDGCELLALPTEIREMIWKEVMTGKVIHLSIVGRKLIGSVCRYGEKKCRMEWTSCLAAASLPSTTAKSMLNCLGVLGLVMSSQQM